MRAASTIRVCFDRGTQWKVLDWHSLVAQPALVQSHLHHGADCPTVRNPSVLHHSLLRRNCLSPAKSSQTELQTRDVHQRGCGRKTREAKPKNNKVTDRLGFGICDLHLTRKSDTFEYHGETSLVIIAFYSTVIRVCKTSNHCKQLFQSHFIHSVKSQF